MVRRLCYLGCIAGLLLSGSGQGLTQNALPDAPQTIVRPQPDAQGIYHVGDGVSAPKLILQVEPESPRRPGRGRSRQFANIDSSRGDTKEERYPCE